MQKTRIIKTSTDGPVEKHTYAYELMLPKFLAEWDVWDYWEKERLASMVENLKFGDVLFDIGTEHGALSALYAKYIVGGENMVLFEPTPEFWPNIKAIWKANNLKKPKGTFPGFVGAAYSRSLNTKKLMGKFPSESRGKETEAMPYRYIHNDTKNTPIVTIDEYVKETGIIPDAITIDVEGAEFEVIYGAMKVLKTHKPITWVSIHPDMMQLNYGHTLEDFMKFMQELGFFYRLLAVDHEHHYVFWHKDGKQLA